MKKIPSLFKREFDDEHNITNCTREVTKGCEWVINGEGVATEKLDGTCCYVRYNFEKERFEILKRYDAKKGKTPPPNAIPCQPEPDPITGHWPHWVLCDRDNPEDTGHFMGLEFLLDESDASGKPIYAGTYELYGNKIQSNPYDIPITILERHGERVLKDVPRDYDGIKKYLEEHYIEGIVFHRENGDMCKIKRTDFNFDWNNSTQKRRNR